MKLYIFFSILLIIGTVSIMGCSSIYKGPKSDHFDGTRFYHNEKDYTFGELVKWMVTMNPAKWPKWIDDKQQPNPPVFVKNGALRVTHINHATMLIQVDGINILTDPIWSERTSMVSWAGPKRVRAPGFELSMLPRIDIILISHNHYDHLDLPTLKEITKNNNPKIFVGLGVGSLLAENKIKNVTEMDWWQEENLGEVGDKVVFVPARHNSGRGLLDKNKTLWGGFVIESSVGNIYFAGDTGYGDFLASIKSKYDSFVLAMLPIGHYEPRWMMESHHMNPDDAVKLHQYLNVKASVGMHFATFGGHNDEEVDAHEKDLSIALAKYKVSNSDFVILGFGEGKDISN